MHSANIGRIASGDIDVDPVLASGRPDRRRGISLIIPVQGIAPEYQGLVDDFEAAYPGQYYYPCPDLHVTIFDFIQARLGYRPDGEREAAILGIAREAAAGIAPFRILFKGVAFSRSAGIIRGYDGGRLVAMRKAIRAGLSARGMPNDERYESRTAHATFARFKSELADPAALCAAIERNKARGLGGISASEAELVEHDWYNSLVSLRRIGKVAFGALPDPRQDGE